MRAPQSPFLARRRIFIVVKSFVYYSADEASITAPRPLDYFGHSKNSPKRIAEAFAEEPVSRWLHYFRIDAAMI